MLKVFLDEAMAVLDELVSTTKQDIQNIMQAKHSCVDESVKHKSALIKKFETAKRNLDKELVALAQKTGNIQDALDDEVRQKLIQMRAKLEELNAVNKAYSKHVVAVKEFFDSLAKQMFDIDSNAYTKGAGAAKIYKAKV